MFISMLSWILLVGALLCLGPHIHTIEAKAVSKVRYNSQEKAYYLYKPSGKKVSKEGIYSLEKKKANSRTFNGIYYVSSKGRIRTAAGLERIKRKVLKGTTYYGGYYYFARGGRMDTTKAVHKLNTTYKGVTYKGYYCFAGPRGRMVRNKGLVTLDRNVYYYVRDNYGKCLTKGKKKVSGFTYTFKANGTGRRTNTKLGSLKSRLASQLRGYGGTWSVYVKRLDNNDSITINDTPLYAASIIKPYVMASTYNQIRKKAISETGTITSLNRSMITVSSNDAFNELVKRQTKSYNFSTGRSIVNTYIKNQGYTKTSVHHTLHPASGSLISDGGSNRTSVKDCGSLLESIYRGTCVDSQSSKKMLNFLLAQQRRWKIPAGVPSGTKVANKTGETSSSDHDIAIVYSPRCTYILCVMSANAPYSSSRVAAISRTVYNYFN